MIACSKAKKKNKKDKQFQIGLRRLISAAVPCNQCKTNPSLTPSSGTFTLLLPPHTQHLPPQRLRGTEIDLLPHGHALLAPTGSLIQIASAVRSNSPTLLVATEKTRQEPRRAGPAAHGFSVLGVGAGSAVVLPDDLAVVARAADAAVEVDRLRTVVVPPLSRRASWGWSDGGGGGEERWLGEGEGGG